MALFHSRGAQDFFKKIYLINFFTKSKHTVFQLWSAATHDQGKVGLNALQRGMGGLGTCPIKNFSRFGPEGKKFYLNKRYRRANFAYKLSPATTHGQGELGGQKLQ